MKIKGFASTTCFMDLLLNSLLGVLCLFILSLALIKQDDKRNQTPEIPGDYLISIVWSPKQNVDVDTYVEFDNKDLIFFQKKECGFLNLERDDLGHVNDTVKTPSGTDVVFEENRELVTIRRALDGEYVVNVHLFKGSEAVPVTVTLERIRPYGMVTKNDVVLTGYGDEKTAFRFTIKDGSVVALSTLSKPLAKTKHNNTP